MVRLEVASHMHHELSRFCHGTQASLWTGYQFPWDRFLFLNGHCAILPLCICQFSGNG